MFSFLRSMMLLPGLLLWYCHPEPTGPDIQRYPGMVSIDASETFFVMGSTDQWAASDEKPPIHIGFTYNFYMDTTEVTVAQYWRVTGTLPSNFDISDTALTSPICFVTWYDALLFCNMRSIAEGLDTVYSYTSIEKNTAGRTFKINNLRMDLTQKGYRLPTEAEWEFTAHGGGTTVFPWGDTPDSNVAARIAWYGQNADDIRHPVATLEKNGYGLYDLFGNVAEWVNDWKGFYAPDTLTNYIGPSISLMDEHPVKGGSYLHTIAQLRPSSRSDTYTTLSSTAAKYLGFRCCIGAISSASRLPSDKEIDSTNPVDLVARSDLSFLPGRNAKLVFVNRTGDQAFLCYINFNEPNPRVYQYTDITPVYTPTISPNGDWVAFCTGPEGASEGSDIYIRKLDKTGSLLNKLAEEPAFIPRWWVDIVSNDTFLIYTNSAIPNDDPRWNSTSTKMLKMVDGSASGAPAILNADGSYHGGYSSNKKYLATGYTQLRMKDLLNGESKILFTAPQNGKQEPDTSQVCNVSISSDHTHPGRVMFLDFGSGKTPSTLIGSTYETHEIIFIADFTGTTIAWYRCPAHADQWDHPEWSNHSDYAVAAVKTTAAPQLNSELYVINLKDTTYHLCVKGTDLLQPYLWISSTQNPVITEFDPDSAGWYNDPPSGMYQKNFSAKMPHFLKHLDSVEILSLGSSRIQNGVIPLTYTAHHGFNFGYAAGGLAGVKNLLNNYALPHSPNLKVVAISLDICWFDLEDGDYSWVNGIDQTKGNVYDRSHNYWLGGFPEGFIDHVLTIPEAQDEAHKPIIAQNGWYPVVTNGWGPNPPEIQKRWEWNINQTVLDNIQQIYLIAKDLQERSIHLIGILFPQSPHFRNTTIYGFEGPTTETAQQIITLLHDIEQRNDCFHIYDAHLFGEHDYTDEDAFDNCHLSESGAYKFSGRFNVLLDSILAIKK